MFGGLQFRGYIAEMMTQNIPAPTPQQRKIIAILVEGRKRCFQLSERHTEKQSSRSAVPPTAISLNRVVGSSSSAPGRAEPRIPSIAPTATFRSSPQTQRCVNFPTGRLQLPHACTQLFTLRPPPVSATVRGEEGMLMKDWRGSGKGWGLVQRIARNCSPFIKQ